MAREVNGGTEWALDYEVGTGGSVWSGVPVLGELRRVGLEDRKATTIASGGHDRAEMVEMADGRMESQGSSIGRAM